MKTNIYSTLLNPIQAFAIIEQIGLIPNEMILFHRCVNCFEKKKNGDYQRKRQENNMKVFCPKKGKAAYLFFHFSPSWNYERIGYSQIGENG